MTRALILSIAPVVAVLACTCSCSNAPGRTGMLAAATYVVRCDGPAQRWSLCYSEATDQCGGDGYRILERTEPAAPGYTRRGPGEAGPAADDNARVMRISCGAT